MVKRWTKQKPTDKHAHSVAANHAHAGPAHNATAQTSLWKRKKKLFIRVGLGLSAALVAGFLTYYSLPLRAESRELSIAKNMLTVRYEDTSGAIVLLPLGEAKRGIVLYPGARVEPAAYAYKMSQVAQAGIAVVIVKPLLHLPPIDIRQPDSYTNLVDTVTNWYVAGHSLGGVKACQVAASHPQFKGLILLGAYCSGNASGLGMPVLSIGGSADALTTPEDIRSRKDSMPQNTAYEMIEGLNHAGFGDYGTQGGDGDMQTNDAEVLQKMTAFITRFIGMTTP